MWKFALLVTCALAIKVKQNSTLIDSNVTQKGHSKRALNVTQKGDSKRGLLKGRSRTMTNRDPVPGPTAKNFDGPTEDNDGGAVPGVSAPVGGLPPPTFADSFASNGQQNLSCSELLAGLTKGTCVETNQDGYTIYSPQQAFSETVAAVQGLAEAATTYQSDLQALDFTEEPIKVVQDYCRATSDYLMKQPEAIAVYCDDYLKDIEEGTWESGLVSVPIPSYEVKTLKGFISEYYPELESTYEANVDTFFSEENFNDPSRATLQYVKDQAALFGLGNLTAGLPTTLQVPLDENGLPDAMAIAEVHEESKLAGKEAFEYHIYGDGNPFD